MKKILPYLLIVTLLIPFAGCKAKQPREGAAERTLYTTLTPTSAAPTTIPPAAYPTAPAQIPTSAPTTAAVSDTAVLTTGADTTATTVLPVIAPTTAPTTAASPTAVPTTESPTTEAPATQKKTACTYSIDCKKALSYSGTSAMLPADGVILPAQSVEITEGESVFDVLQRVCRENGIPMEFSMAPIYNTAYIEGIGDLYEFDCGSMSGWMYCVNGVYPNYGCSKYELKDGDVVEWHYTLDNGADLGAREP